MDEPLFVVRLDQPRYALGDRVHGRLVFSPDDRLAKVKLVTVRLRAFVHGSGNDEEAVRVEQQLHQGPVTALALPFEFHLPADGPVSWQGRHVKVDWTVVGELDLPWAVDPKASACLEVVPRGVAVSAAG